LHHHHLLLLPNLFSTTTSTTRNPNQKWSIDSWKSKKALQQPEYPNPTELDSVLKTLESFPPIVLSGEARSLEERIGQASMGNAFLLQGGDCAESFKEFGANNIKDTFRVLLIIEVRGSILTNDKSSPLTPGNARYIFDRSHELG
ncbi:Phospho-2-dehydro-3-deoxyheptonate aldolase 1 chloroplastic, partial [Bienertia sinuspersici]